MAGRDGTTLPKFTAEGIAWADLCAAARFLPLAPFEAASPGPFLLELPDALTLPDWPAIEDRLSSLRGAQEVLSKMRVWSLAGVGSTGRVVGRAGVDANLGYKDASRRHAQLSTSDRGVLQVTDLESVNGTKVEGRRLPVGIPSRIDPGQVLNFSGHRAVLLDVGQLHGLFAAGEDTRRGWRLRQEIVTPAEGRPLRDVIEDIGKLSKAEFLGSGAGFLLQVPVDHDLPTEPESSDGEDDPDFEGTQPLSRTRIMNLKRSRDIRNARVHIVFPGEGAMVVGRSAAQCDLVLPEAAVSKKHAELHHTPNGWHILDLGSHNGTYAEGEKLPSGVLVQLKGGTSLSLSSYAALWLTPPMIGKFVGMVRAKKQTRRPG